MSELNQLQQNQHMYHFWQNEQTPSKAEQEILYIQSKLILTLYKSLCMSVNFAHKSFSKYISEGSSGLTSLIEEL